MDPQNTDQSLNNSQQVPTSSPAKSWLVIAGSLALILVGIGGVWAYTRFNQPAAEDIMAQVRANTAAVTSFEYTGNISLELTTKNPLVEMLTDTGASGTGSLEEKKTMMVDIGYDGITQKESADTSVAVKASVYSPDDTDNKMAVGFDIRKIEDSNYFRLNQVPAFGLVGMIAGPFKGQWIEINTSDLQELQEGLPVGDAVADVDIKEKQEELTPEKVQEISEMVLAADIVTFTDTLPSEEVNGVPSYHYVFTINKEKLADTVKSVLEKLDYPVEEEDLEEFRTALTKVTFTDGHLWVSKKSLLVQKVQYGFTYADDDVSAKVAMTAMYHNYNNAPAIEKPEEAKTIEELFGSLYQDTQPLPVDENVSFMGPNDTDTDGDGILDRMEVSFGTDPSKYDSDGDGFGDGEELANGYDPLKAGEKL